MMTAHIDTAPASPPIRRALFFGIIGVLSIGVAPLTLGRLVEVGRLSAEMIGIGIMAELFGLAIGATFGGAVLGKGKTRFGVAGILVLIAVSNLACVYMSGANVAWMRLLAGFGGGTLIWCAVASILRTSTPERLSGIFLTTQTAAQFLLAFVLASFLLSHFGPTTGYTTLALIALASLPVTLGFPDVRPMAEEKTKTSALPLAGWLGLFSIGFFMAMLNTVVAYAEAQLVAAGVPSTVALNIFTVVLASQIIGGTAASALSERLAFTPIIFTLYAFLAAIITGLWLLSGTGLLFALYALFGFIWLFIAPFHVGFLLNLDPAKRAAELSPAAQLLGLALGPLIAAAVLTEAGTVPVWLPVSCLGISLVFFTAALKQRG